MSSRFTSVAGVTGVAGLIAVLVVASPAWQAAGSQQAESPQSGTASAAGVVSALRAGDHWVHSWAAMPQLTEPGNMPPAPFTGDGQVLVDTTLRQTIHVSVGGGEVRLRFSNAFGGADLPITSAAVALPVDGQAGVSGIRSGTSRALTFGGRSAVVVPVGAEMVSDPVRFSVAARSNLTVTVYLASGQSSTNITSHPGSRTTSYLIAGDHVTDPDLVGATTATHWYFLSGLEVREPADTAAAVVLGDSLTDGRGSTTNGNDRWPDQFLDRLQTTVAGQHVAVINEAAGGNRVLHDGLGPNALARFDRDILATSGVRWLVVFEGVNDIGTADATQAAQDQVADDLIAAYEQMILRAHAQGIAVYGATLLPFGQNASYDDAQGYRESAREKVNAWIRAAHHFDAVLDFDRVVRDPAAPRDLLASIDTGDHLHLTPAGYGMLAGSIPLDLFRPGR